MRRWTGCIGAYCLASIVVLQTASLPLPRTTALPAQQPVVAPAHLEKLVNTYSIVAFDSVTGDLGVAVQSKFPNVGGLAPMGAVGRRRGRDAAAPQPELR